MAVQDDEYNISLARAAGASFYELAIDNWANTGASADANSLVYPAPGSGQPTLDGVYGVMISPNSLWDRCALEYQPYTGSADKFIVLTMQLSVGAPVMFPLPGRISVIPTEDPDGIINVNGGPLAGSRWFSSYYKDGAVVTTPFVTSIVGIGGYTVATEARLNLLFFLQPPGMTVSSRAPMIRDVLTAFTGTGSEGGPVIYNVSGRRRLRMTMGTLSAGTWSLRVALMGTGSGATFAREATVTTSAGVTAGNVVPFDLSANLPADWLMIYATRTDAPGADGDFQIHVEAYDA